MFVFFPSGNTFTYNLIANPLWRSERDSKRLKLDVEF